LKIVREILPVIHEPLARLFSKANVGTHFEVLFKSLKRILKVAELKEPSLQKRLSRYEIAAGKFIRDLYSFLHFIAANDDSTLEDTLKWVVDLLAFAEADPIDVQRLLWPDDVNMTDLRDRVISEIESVTKYKAALMGYDEEIEKQLEQQNQTPSEKSSPFVDNCSTICRPVLPILIEIPKLVDEFIQLSTSYLCNHAKISKSEKAMSPIL